MRLSSKAVYGVHALFDMAFHGEGRQVQAREVADRHAIPPRYLEQILRELRRAGLVEAKRGPGGGYALARSAEVVRVSDVVMALDGPITGVRPEGDGPPDVPARLLCEIGDRIEAALAAVTIRDLVVRAEALGMTRATPAPQMYFI